MTATPISQDDTIPAGDYRRIFGRLPTGVVAITGTAPDGKPLGFVVGTFQSLSIDPPLVTFSVDKSSSTWPALRNLKNFTANILSTDQLSVCRALSRKGEDKFKDLSYEMSTLGTPRFPGSSALIDCSVLSEIVAGDHYVIVGSIAQMEDSDRDALVFRGGKFGEFTQWDEPAPKPKPIVEEGVGA